MLLDCKETKKWGENIYVANELLEMRTLASKRIVNFAEATDLKSIGIYLYKVGCKWESKASKIQ
jgi:hypothetical protein